MKKKIFAACMLISLLLSSCSGVKQEEYDALKVQKEALEKQNDSLSEELENWTMGDAALTTMCDQIKDGTTYCILNDDTVMFVLPLNGNPTAETVGESYDAILDYMVVLSALYDDYTDYEKFVFRVQSPSNEMIVEFYFDYTSGSPETSFTYNYLYYDVIQEMMNSRN